MSKKIRVLWIDDENRERASLNMRKQLGVISMFINVETEDSYLSSVDEFKPDLILIDHNLTRIRAGEMKKGSTIAALIREKHPRCAIACITGQDSDNMDSQQRSSYEAVFKYDDIKKYYSTMKSIALSYRQLSSTPPKNVKGLLNLMKAPPEEFVRLETIFPSEIKENFTDPGIFASISHWIRNILVERPGFLYDRLWAATLFGLNEAGFKKVEEIFKSAKYKGIFSDESKDRWWKCKLLDILSTNVKEKGLPWEKGRHLKDINSRNYSKDYYSDYKEEYPEVVAYIDETSDERAQMKLKYTVQHPKYDKLLFFEEIRMMKAD